MESIPQEIVDLRKDIIRLDKQSQDMVELHRVTNDILEKLMKSMKILHPELGKVGW